MKRLMYILLFNFASLGSALGQDLTTQNLQLSNTTIGIGGVISPFAYVANIGDNFATSSNLGFYISTDTILTVSDTYLGGNNVSSLYPGETSYVEAFFNIPSSLTEGTYYLFAYADNTGLVFETNEKNNSKFVPFTLATLSVDLVINSISPTSTVHVAGDILSGVVVEHNNGNTYANSNYIGYYLSTDSILDGVDTFLGYDYTDVISPGSDVYDYPSFYLPTSVDTGSYYIIAYADYDNYNQESNENNNTSFSKIVIIPTITDLAITSIASLDTNTSKVIAGNYFYPLTTVANVGTSFLSNIAIGYYLSTDSVFGPEDTFLSSSYLGYLYGNSSTTDNPGVYFPPSVPAGNYYLIALADYNNQIEETTEENNVKALAIKVIAPNVDLTIGGLSVSTNNVTTNGFVNASLYEFNEGNAAASSHFVGYYLSVDSTYDIGDTFLSSDYVFSNYPGSFVYFNPSLFLPSTIPNGDYYLIAVADYEGVIPDSNRSNNVQAIPITITSPYVDLSVSFIPQDSSSSVVFNVMPGSSIVPQVQDQNSGNTAAYGIYTGYYISSDTTYDIGDTFLGGGYTDYLNPGGYIASSLYVTMPNNLPAGTSYLLAVVDYPLYIAESDEGNNVAVATLIVTPGAVDLSISFVSTDSLTVNPGDYIYPSLNEYNTGTTDAYNHSVGYYLSTDAYFDANDIYLSNDYIGQVFAGSSIYLNPTIYIPTYVSGDYYVLAVADNATQVSETNEDNNTSALRINVRPSRVDLSIYGFSVTSPVVTPGSYFYATGYEFNNGYSYSSTNYVGYYLSTDSVYDSGDLNLGSDYVNGVDGLSYASLAPYMYMPYVATGNYYLIAVADVYGYIPEYDENNNTQAIRITVGENGVDLTIPSLSATNTNPSAGSFIYVTNTETNIGNLDASGHFVGYFLSTDSTYDVWDTYLSTNYLAGLTAGSSTVFNPALFIPASVSDGVYYIVAVADYGSGVSEINEYNNTKALRITIGNVVIPPSVAELGLLEFYPNSNFVLSGQSVVVNFVDYNSGAVIADPHNIDFYLSDDTTVSVDDEILSIQYEDSTFPGAFNLQTTHVLIPFGTASGSHFIIGMTDAGNNVEEINEYNNTRSFLITVNGIVTGNETSVLGSSGTTLFPNPSTGIVNFTSLSNADEIQVLDLNGHLLVNKKAETMTGNALDLNSLSAGVYLVKTIKDGTATSTNKLVISK